ncbi:50S ribosomal protein L9 [Candidatus Uhrbacteria bacterium]|nr:50S ribosomal protein L9 [Candidatus Uhrbacteria bacterium]
MNVKVILLQDVPDLGDRDDIVEVSEGHARNFLIPEGKAVLATIDEVRAVEERKAARARAAEEELRSIQKLAEQLDGLEVPISVKVSDAGTLYAAVTKEKIAGSLKALGYTVALDWIQLPEPLKQEGEFDVLLEFPHKLDATIKVIVKGEEK